MALDKATQELLAQFATQGGKPLNEQTPDEARAFSSALAAMSGEGPAVKEVTDTTIPVKDGSIELIIIKPLAEPIGLLIYYHGGGWVIGDVAGYVTLGQTIADTSNCIVVLVNYRKAPENRFPVAVEDAYAALQWVDENMLSIAGKKLPIILSGDSAGGNLTTVMAIKSRDNNGPKISLQVPVYPVTADDFENESYIDPENQLLLTKDAMVWFFDHYVPNKEDRKHIDVSPLYVKDLSGLPPTILITAGHDPLRKEGEAFAARLIEAGVPVVFKRYDDQLHGFFSMVNILPASKSAISFISFFIKSHIESNIFNHQ